jgi:photosystem II stability/assembly factor-like uncharacterized protein
MSDNYGVTWASIATNLPLSPVNVIREDPVNENILYLGADNGAYVSFNNGSSWEAFNEGLPNVAVHDLVVQAREKDLVVGTHGRSIYTADISLVQQISQATMGTVMIADMPSIRASRSWGSKGFNQYRDYFEPSLDINMFAPAAGNATISVTSESGRELKNWSEQVPKGFNKIVYNGSVSEKGKKQLSKDEMKAWTGDNETSYLPRGIYTVSVSVNGKSAKTILELK